jgi:hypothetical protein
LYPLSNINVVYHLGVVSQTLMAWKTAQNNHYVK